MLVFWSLRTLDLETTINSRFAAMCLVRDVCDADCDYRDTAFASLSSMQFETAIMYVCAVSLLPVLFWVHGRLG